MPAPTQESSSFKAFLASIRQRLSTVSSYVLAGVLMIFRPMVGLFAAAGFGTLNLLRNGAGVVVGGIAEFVNLVLRRGLGVLVGTVVTLAHLFAQLSTFVGGVVAEIVVNVFRVVGGIAAELGWIIWSAALKPLAAAGLVLANTFRQLLGGLVAGVVELLNIIRLGLGVVIGAGLEVVVTIIRGLSAVFAEAAALLWPVAKILIGAFAEIVNLLRQGLGVISGLIAAFASILWQGVGLVLAAVLEVTVALLIALSSVIIEVASAAWALFKGPIAVLAEAGYFLVNALIRIAGFVVLETLNLLRVVVGYTLGAVLGATVGILFGGIGGFKSVFKAVKNTFIEGEYEFGSWYKGVFSPMFGEEGAYQPGCIAKPIWNSSTYTPGKAAKSVFGPVYSVGGVFKQIYHHTVFGDKDTFNPSKAFYAVHHSAFFGKKGSYEFGKWFSQLRESSTYTAGERFKQVFNHDVFGGEYKFGHVFSAVRSSTAFKGSVGDTLPKVFYHPIFGKKGSFHPADQFASVWNSTTYQPGQAFKLVFNLGQESAYEVGQTFEAVNSLSGDLRPRDVFRDVFNAPLFGGDRYQPGKAFNIFNRSKLFGSQPWAEQRVARDAFAYFTNFEIDAGVSAWVDQGKADQSFFYKNANRTIAVMVGLAEGLVLWGPHIIATAVAAFAGGFKRGGLLGAIGNVLRDFFLLSLTYPFRNAYRNVLLVLREEELGTSIPKVWFPVFRQDIRDAYTGADIDWSGPVFDGAPDAEEHAPVQGHAVMRELGGVSLQHPVEAGHYPAPLGYPTGVAAAAATMGPRYQQP